jgi:pantoate--beta-alanine ligase
MNIVTDLNQWRSLRKTLAPSTIGFVPTMGYLHEGHLSLCERARAENEICAASIFINPTQFNQSSDFEKYPQDLLRDQQLLTKIGVDYLLLPQAADMYPDQYSFQVTELELATSLEGKCRSGHFTGMLTVVLKLLNLVQATRAYFGEKDYQQYLLIKKMADALFLNTSIIACPTVRAHDGLAMSSRNVRLNQGQRIKAALFPKILRAAVSAELAHQSLISAGFLVDYVADQWSRRLAAVWLDEIRLIDNIELR